jgi:hypothetical protein
MKKNKFFWIRVKELMDSRRITGGMLALLLDVHPKILKKWIFWSYAPDDPYTYKIANIFGVTQEYLMHGRIDTDDAA